MIPLRPPHARFALPADTSPFGMLRIEGGGSWRMLMVAPRLTLRRSREVIAAASAPYRHSRNL
jgi:hypothetical protein